MLLQSVLAKLTGAGLATKAAAGGAAVVVAASAAGAADALPEPAQDAFERLTAEETVEVEDLEDEAGDDVGAADTDANFGERVSEDAKDGGVDGCEIAREASGKALEDCGTDDGEDTEDLESSDDEGPEEGSFGERVSQDATGEDGSEPGVDGREIADEAKENGDGDDTDADTSDVDDDDSDVDDDDDDDDDEGGPEGTPGEDAVNTFRPDDEG